MAAARPPNRPFLSALAIGVAIAVVISGSIALAQPRPALHVFVSAMGIGAVYVAFIALPAGLIFPRAAKRLENKKPIVKLVTFVSLIVTVNVVGGLGSGLLLIAAGVFEAHAYATRFLPGAAVAVAIGLLIGLGAGGYQRLHDQLERAAGDLHRKELERAQAAALAAEARLASLESRIRPHFLFNALNAALALIPDDAAAAERVLERVASLLRSSLDAGAGELIPLAREMAMVTDYLEIQRVRFGVRLRAEIDVDEKALAAGVPPFAVQTLVENSVKYAIADRPAGGLVQVQARVEQERVVVVVRDDGPGFAPTSVVPGHGLHALRTRLSTLFGARATLVIDRPEAGGSAVTLELPGASEAA